MSRLNDIRQSIGAFWGRLTQHEQSALTVMTAACAAFGFYLLIALPAVDYRDAARRTLDADQARLQRIMALLEQSKGHQGGEIDRSKPARTRVLNAARQAGITIDRVDPEADGFSVAVRAVSASELFAWIAEIENRQGVPVIAADISKSLSGATLDAEVSFGDGG